MLLQSTELHYRYENSEKELIFPDLQLKKQSIVVVLGSSGVGKSTLLQLLAGYLKPTNGVITVNNVSINNFTKTEFNAYRSYTLGVLFQNIHLIPHLTVIENLRLLTWLHSKPIDETWLQTLIEQLQLTSVLHQKAIAISKGQSQRVGIARALLRKPALILVDEPTSALDDDNAQRVGVLLQKMVEEIGCGMVMVTHDQRMKGLTNNLIML